MRLLIHFNNTLYDYLWKWNLSLDFRYKQLRIALLVKTATNLMSVNNSLDSLTVSR
jgi:hypothetical protein